MSKELKGLQRPKSGKQNADSNDDKINYKTHKVSPPAT